MNVLLFLMFYDKRAPKSSPDERVPFFADYRLLNVSPVSSPTFARAAIL